MNAQLDATVVSAERASTASAAVGARMRKLGTAAKVAGGALAIGFVVEAKKAVGETQALAKETLLLHKTLGLSARSASEFAAVAQTRGIDIRSLNMSMKTLATQFVNARRGTQTSEQAFKRLGVPLSDLNNKGRNFEQVLTDVADAMANTKGSASKMAAAGTLLGRGWQSLLPIFNQGGKGLKELMDNAGKVGDVLTGKTLKAQLAFRQESLKAQEAIHGLETRLAVALTPALISVATAFSKFVEGIQSGRGAGGEFARFMTANFAPLLKRLGDLIGYAVDAWQRFADVVGKNRAILLTIIAALAILSPELTAIVAASILVAKNWESIRALGIRVADAITDAEKAAVAWVVAAKRWVTTLIPVRIALFQIGLALMALKEALRVVEPIMKAVLIATLRVVIDQVKLVIEVIRQMAIVVADVVKVIGKLLHGDFSGAWEAAKQTVHDVASGIGHILERMVNLVGDQFKGMKDVMVAAMTSAWDTIRGVFTSGVNSIKDAVNWVIDNVINRIPGVQISVASGSFDAIGTHHKGLAHAQGGGGPGPHRGAAKGAKVTQPGWLVGEEAPRHPEYVLATNPAYRKRNIGLWQQAGKMLGIPGFALGGVTSAIGGAAKSAAGAVSGAVGKVAGALDPGHFISMVKDRLGKLPDWLSGFGSFATGKFASFIKDKLSFGLLGGPSGAGGPVPSGSLADWLTKALKITDHFSAANLSALYGRAIQESGGNPRAINLWDSNAAAGTPSMGLLQTIMPTFQAYALKGYGDIWNPVDNAIAAIRYMFARYGHIVGPSSSGYAMGGLLGFKKGGSIGGHGFDGHGHSRVHRQLRHARHTLKDIEMGNNRRRISHVSARVDRLSTLLGLMREQHQVGRQRRAVSHAQASVFGGSFANGGIVPGPIGAPRIVEAHGGERITPPGSATVEINFASGMEWLERFIEVKVDGQTRKKARAADRRLPGRPGVLR